jgi:hypothetical protein
MLGHTTGGTKYLIGQTHLSWHTTAGAQKDKHGSLDTHRWRKHPYSTKKPNNYVKNVVDMSLDEGQGKIFPSHI